MCNSERYQRLPAERIVERKSGFVEVEGGIAGFFRHTLNQNLNEMRNAEYPYSENDPELDRTIQSNWIFVKDFQQIYKRREHPNPNSSEWNDDIPSLTVRSLYAITLACSSEMSLYVGIGYEDYTDNEGHRRKRGGGEAGLIAMRPEIIIRKEWQLKIRDEPPNPRGNWIKGEVFCRILKSRDDIDIQSL